MKLQKERLEKRIKEEESKQSELTGKPSENTDAGTESMDTDDVSQVNKFLFLIFLLDDSK